MSSLRQSNNLTAQSAAAVTNAKRAEAVRRLMLTMGAQVAALAIAVTQEQRRLNVAQAQGHAVAVAHSLIRAANKRRHQAQVAARIAAAATQAAQRGDPRAQAANHARAQAVRAAAAERQHVRYAAKVIGPVHVAGASTSAGRSTFNVGPRKTRAAPRSPDAVAHALRRAQLEEIILARAAKKRAAKRASRAASVQEAATNNVVQANNVMPAVIITVESREILAPIRCLVDASGQVDSINLHYLNSLRPHRIRSFKKPGNPDVDYVLLNVSVNFAANKPLVFRVAELQIVDHGATVEHQIVLGAAWVAAQPQ